MTATLESRTSLDAVPRRLTARWLRSFGPAQPPPLHPYHEKSTP